MDCARWSAAGDTFLHALLRAGDSETVLEVLPDSLVVSVNLVHLSCGSLRARAASSWSAVEDPVHPLALSVNSVALP